MPAISVRSDWDAERVRAAARLAEDAGQVRRLLAIAAVYDGMSRAAAARLGGMDRQTLRDWVHRFNTAGPLGLIDRKAPGAAPRLSGEQEAELAALVEAGPALETEGVVCWRCIDLKALIRRRFGVDYHERTIGKLLNRLGFLHISQRPRHYGQNPEDIAAFKKSSPNAWRRS
jgi:putative transposase